MSIAATPFDFTNRPKPKLFEHGHTWGDWRLDAKALALNYEPGGSFVYGVDIEHMRTAWNVLDAICQVARKRLARTDPEDMPTVTGHLVTALNDIFVPQHTMRLTCEALDLRVVERDGVVYVEALA